MIVASEPQLFVSDVDAAIGFYVAKLGFTLAFAHGEPAFYAQVRRDHGRLNLRHVDGPVFQEGFHTREPDTVIATLAVDDAEPLFVEFQKAGVVFHQPLKTEPWGARTFIVRDPDGNLILFAGG
jgi:uncharacterized glyoxalase superfamily protein PhnB